MYIQCSESCRESAVDLHKIGGQSDSHRIFKRRIKTHEAVYILYIHNFSSKSGFQTNIYLMIYCPKIK